MQTKQQAFNPFRSWMIIVVLGIFFFMVVLDSSIVNIAMPVIAHSLGVQTNQVEWLVSTYLIGICIFLLFFGRLGDMYGRIRIFMIGTFIFILGSLLSGIDLGLPFLLTARFIQSVGASMTMANSFAIATAAFPVNRRGRALGVEGMFVSLGAITGPGIGGLILSHLSWPFIFWINVPIGIFAIILGVIFLPHQEPIDHDAVIDWVGFGTFGLFIATFFVGIFIGQASSFARPLVLGLMLVGLVALGLFIKVERHFPQPLVQLNIFANREFSIGISAAFLNFGVSFFFNVLSPFYLEQALHLKTDLSGLILMLLPLTMMIMSPIAGWFSDHFNPNAVSLIGLLIYTISQVGLAVLTLQNSLVTVSLVIIVSAIGLALFQTPNNSMVMSVVDPKYLGIAGSINSLARELGLVVGVAGATSILFGTMSLDEGRVVTNFLANRPQVFMAGQQVTYLVAAVISALTTILVGINWHAHRQTLQEELNAHAK